MNLGVLEVVVLYVLSVFLFQMEVHWCTEKLDCLRKVLHLV